MNAFTKGWLVAFILAVLTIVEYIFAVNVPDDLVRFSGLSVAALLKAFLIIVYFMHIARAWQLEEAH